MRRPRKIMEIEDLFLLGEYRIKGIGQSMIDLVIQFGKDNDYTDIFLVSGKQRKGAHEFYRQLGFEEYGYHYKLKL